MRIRLDEFGIRVAQCRTVTEVVGCPVNRSTVFVAALPEGHERCFGRFVGADRDNVVSASTICVWEKSLVPVPELVIRIESFPDCEDAVNIARYLPRKRFSTWKSG